MLLNNPPAQTASGKIAPTELSNPQLFRISKSLPDEEKGFAIEVLVDQKSGQLLIAYICKL